jgi:superfamily II DNA or RNA helicase
MDIKNLVPVATGGGAVFPYSQKLEEACKRLSRYGEEYNLGRVVGGNFLLPRNMFPVADIDDRTSGTAVFFHDNFKPRNEDQAEVVAKARQLIANGDNFIVQAPTGYGKTYVGCAVAAKLNRRTVVITTKEDIISQWVKAAQDVLGLEPHEVGVWRGDEVPNDDATFVIALVQSVMKGYERYPEALYDSFGLIICDEVHRMGANEFSQAMWWFKGRFRLGLSATPYRKDGRDVVFNTHIGPVKVVAKLGVMVPFVVCKRTNWKLPLVWRNGQMKTVEYKPGRTMHLSKDMSENAERNSIITNFVKQAYKAGRNTIVFVDIVQHMYTLALLLENECGVDAKDIGFYAGLDSGVYKGADDKKQEREKAKTKPIILATYRMASEATDIPWLDTCVLTMPYTDVVQIVGRIRREWPDKKTPLVLDLIDGNVDMFQRYAFKRLHWYQSIGAEVKTV